MGRRNIRKEKKVAQERVEELFEQADELFSEDPKRSHRYVDLARKLAMRYKVRIPSDLQKKFCKHCYKYLRPGANCRVRTQKGKVVYTCEECGGHMRFPMWKEQAEKRAEEE